jgi:polyhydroxyalkanoate synthase
MQKWIADNPPFPARAFREWVTWIYKENQLASGLLRIRGKRADLSNITQSLLILTADNDHIVPPQNSIPILDLTSSTDTFHLAKPGGHIGLMAGAKAPQHTWPDVTRWLEQRSQG